MPNMRATDFVRARPGRIGIALSLLTVLALGGCGSLLDVEFPGRIPSEQIDDPSLAPILARSVLGDLECAYNNYSGGSAAQSDEFETSNSNIPLALWGLRSIAADEDSYAVGGCEIFGGMNLTLSTARFQSEDVYKRLQAWTDAQVPNRTLLLAQVRAYGGYAYTFLGETFCKVAFDGGDPQEPLAALTLAEQRLGEAITLGQTAGNTAIVNLARAGLARVKLDLKKYSEAAAAAQLVPVGYVYNADRGAEVTRRWNNIYQFMNVLGAFVVSLPYRTMNDPRVLVADAGRGAFNPEIRLWVTTKYTGLNSPIRLASYREAQLILAEALAQQGQVGNAMTIINNRRADVGLAPLTAATQAEALAAIIEERRKELSFEGGHRLNDLLRYRLPWKGANGSTQTANPFLSRPYAQTTCWPLATKETNGA